MDDDAAGRDIRAMRRARLAAADRVDHGSRALLSRLVRLARRVTSERAGSRGRGAALRIRLAEFGRRLRLASQHERGRDADRAAAEHDAAAGGKAAAQEPRAVIDGVVGDRKRLGQGRLG